MIMHTMPYVFLFDGFFSIAMKVFLFFKVTGIADHYPISIRIIYYIIMSSAIGKSFIILPIYSVHICGKLRD